MHDIWKEAKLAVALPASILALASLLSDVLQFRDYFHNALHLYRDYLHRPLAAVLGLFLPIRLPAPVIDYLVLCSVAFLILNQAARLALGESLFMMAARPTVSFLKSVWYIMGARMVWKTSRFTKVQEREIADVHRKYLLETGFFTLVAGVTVPFAYLASPLVLPYLLYRFATGKLPEATDEKVLADLSRSFGMIRHDATYRNPTARHEANFIRRALAAEGIRLQPGLPAILNFFGWNREKGITRHTSQAVKIGRALRRFRWIALVRVTAFTLFTAFAVIAISVEY